MNLLSQLHGWGVCGGGGGVVMGRTSEEEPTTVIIFKLNVIKVARNISKNKQGKPHER